MGADTATPQPWRGNQNQLKWAILSLINENYKYFVPSLPSSKVKVRLANGAKYQMTEGLDNRKAISTLYRVIR